MSDQGGPSQAGWQPDPFGRHEYRYWDGSAWSDQVSDGGVVASDPPGDGQPTVATPAAPPMGVPLAGGPPPADGGSKRSIPVGLLAVIGVVVAALVAGLFIFVLGGDDDSGGTGEFSGTISEDEPFVVRTFDLEAGEVVRAVVTPEGDFDPLVTLAIDREVVATPLLASLGGSVDEDELQDAVDDESSDYYNDLLSGYDQLLTDGVPDDLVDGLSDELSDDFGGLQDALSDQLPVLAEAGIPSGTEDFNGGGDPEGTVFLAPLGGTYSIIVSGQGSTGAFEGNIEVEGPDEDFDAFAADEGLDLLTYFEAAGAHLDFFCDEDFWGDDPSDVFANADLYCDQDSFAEFLTDNLGTDDFSSDSSDDFSDSTSDFSDDFSDSSSDFSDDLSDDLSDDVGAEEFIGPIAVGENANGFIESNGADVYEIDGTGGNVVIRILGTFDAGGLDPTVQVRDSTGTEIGFDDDSGNRARDSRLEVVLAAGETYEIVVAGFSESAGDYVIRVR